MFAGDDDENRKVLSLSSLIHSMGTCGVGLSHITELAKYRKTGTAAVFYDCHFEAGAD